MFSPARSPGGAPRTSPPPGRFVVEYLVEAPDAEVVARARGICLEQTVEIPATLVPAGHIQEEVVGKVEWMQPAAAAGEWSVGISYADASAGGELTQLINVVFGNSSIQSGVKVKDLILGPGITDLFPGPRFGMAGIRALLGVPHGPLLMTALKPMGRSADELAEMAYRFARGGIDIIKDDHGLANQHWAPYKERVRKCAAAVARANVETGRNCLYCPCLNAPAHLVRERAYFAKQHGCGAVLMLPGITGFDSMNMLAEDRHFGLPIVCHPAFLGAFVSGAGAHGMSHESILGLLPRLAGADATIFPNHGGRFGFTREECQALVRGCREPWAGLKPIFPTPGGGMTLDRVGGIITEYTEDVMLLIGGSLIGHSDDLEANARHFLQVCGRRAANEQSPPAAHHATGLANGAGSVPAGSGRGEAPRKRARRLGPQDPALEGNHCKVLRHNGDFTWKGVPKADYKPPSDKSWDKIARYELVGKRGESPHFHVRYFEVQAGGYSTHEKHVHEHVVVNVRGKGEVQMGDEVWGVKPGDVVYVPPSLPHQFRCPEDAREPYGFLCLVNAERDRPVMVDPADFEPRPGRATKVEGNVAKIIRMASPGKWSRLEKEKVPNPDGAQHRNVSKTELTGTRGESPRFHTRYFELGPGGFTPFEKHSHELVAYVLRGKGEAQVGPRIFTLKAGDLIYTAPGEPHQFRTAPGARDQFGLLLFMNAQRGRGERVDPEELFANTACH